MPTRRNQHNGAVRLQPRIGDVRKPVVQQPPDCLAVRLFAVFQRVVNQE